MSHYARLFGFAVAIFATTIVSAHAVTIATVPVGYAGNAPDPATGSLYGAVDYAYNIGEYDVTNAQYAAFLNAKASSADPFGLWLSPVMNPAGNPGVAGISRSGNGPYSYSVISGYANKPVAGMTWYSAIRFVNWLQNGQGNGDTESGTYTITGGGNNSGTVTIPDAAQRAAWATMNSFHWLLPSENEWYKAAYYDPTPKTYYAYPFQSNTQPSALAPPGTADSGDFANSQGNPAYNSDGYGSYLTDVGSYMRATSPFGAFDMGGDLFQWTDTQTASQTTARGGGFFGTSISSASTARFLRTPAAGYTDNGFRVASLGGPANLPEPSSALLAAMACGVIWCWRRRFKQFA